MHSITQLKSCIQDQILNQASYNKGTAFQTNSDPHYVFQLKKKNTP